MPTLASLPPPPQGQTGVSLSSLKNLPSPPTGQQGVSLQAAQTQPVAPQPQTPMTTQQVAATPIDWNTMGHSFLSGLGNWFNQTAEQFKQGVGQAQQGASEINNGGTPLQGLESGLKTESGIATAISAPLAPVFNAANKVIQPVADAIGSSKTVQDFANSNAGQATSRVAEDLSNAGNVAGTILGGDQVAKVAPKAVNAVQDASTGIKEAFKTTPEEQAIAQSKQLHDSIETAKQAKIAQTKSITAQWEKPLSSPMAAFNGARKVIGKSPEATQKLGELNITPDSIIQDGKYSAADSKSVAQDIRDTAGKLSADGLRPSLQLASKATPTTPAADIKVSDSLIQSQSKGSTVDNIEKIRGIVQEKVAALDRTYPNGIPLDKLHDEAIVFDKNGGFSPVNDASVNNAAVANRAIGRVLRGMVIDKAPKTLPVEAFQSELSKYYKAADYLDSLAGKTAPVSLLQKGIRMASKFAGAAVGEHLTGGVVSAFAGYQIGKAVESALENLHGNAKTMFIHNIEITNPEAFKAVQTYLKNVSEGNTGTPLLPAASTIQLPEGVTKMTPPVPSIDISQPKSIPAAKYPVSVNPKTNKFQTMYRSSPK